MPGQEANHHELDRGVGIVGGKPTCDLRRLEEPSPDEVKMVPIKLSLIADFSTAALASLMARVGRVRCDWIKLNYM